MSDSNETKPTEKKKITKLELLTIGVLFAFAILYFLPKALIDDEKRHDAVLRVSAASYTSKVLDKFATAGKKANINEIAQDVVDELNTLSKNPIDKKKEAFVTTKPCPGCIVVQSDTAMQSIIITGYDKNLKIVVRTVVKPPSFVTYTREQNGAK